MANKMFRQFVNTLEPQVCVLFARVTFGSSGAPTLVTAKSKGFKSIVRNSAGVYTITMGNSTAADTYQALLMVRTLFDEITTVAAPASPAMYLSANAIATAGTFQLTFNTGGTATDPASGEAVYIEVIVKNSSAF